MAEKDLKQKVVLMADDDYDDVILVRNALRECNCDVEFRSVGDGDEAIEYLTGNGRYKDPGSAPRPSLILLDVDMPGKDGIQTLQEIRSNPEIRTIPVVVLTDSRDRDLMLRIYRLGGSAFITKPAVYKDIVKALDRLCEYWFQTVSLPDETAGESCMPDDRIEGVRKNQG